MKKIVILLVILGGFLLTTCENTWEDHYVTDASYIDRSLWEEIHTNPEYTSFAGYIEQFGLEGYFRNSDTLISTKTLFAPSNSALQVYSDEGGQVTESLILYHLIKSYFLLSNINHNIKSLTQNSKFLYFENNAGTYHVDGIELSPYPQRYRDGIIYPLGTVLEPKPSIAEYLDENAAYFSTYINSFDTILMDYANSEIIEIDLENDQIIYDSVYTIYNEFKSKYFDVNYNTRDTFATLLLYTDEQFFNAMDVVAEDLGYPSGKDLPVKWIKEVYFEYYLKTAFFDGLLTYGDLSQDYVVNILGDTVQVDYLNLNPEQEICSNGLIYHYLDLIVPEELYKSEAKTEGESLVYMDVNGKLVLREGVRATYKDQSGNKLDLSGKINYVPGTSGIASNDSAIQITIGSNFDGTFELEVPIMNVFPGRYILDWAGFSTISGIFNVYINDSLVFTRLPFEPASNPGSLISEFDSYNFSSFTLNDLTLHENGVDWNHLRASNSSWNINEFYVESDPTDPEEYYLRDFGDAIVKFEFIGSSPLNSSNTGIVIDYLNLRQR